MRISLGEPGPDCGPDCGGFLDFWREFWAPRAGSESALAATANYHEGLRQKSRAMVRQANKRYDFRAFPVNEHLPEIQAINFSKKETSQGPMYGWYIHPVKPFPVQQLCEQHFDRWYGGFDVETGVLRGYIRVQRIADELTMMYYIFAASGAVGVLNGLLAHVSGAVGSDYLYYHTMNAGSPTRRAFKERVGFSPYELTVD